MNGRAWTPDDTAKLRRLAASGMTDGEIGRALNRDTKCVGRKRREIGIERGMSRDLRTMLARLNMRRIYSSA